jgi:hypothetical protein
MTVPSVGLYTQHITELGELRSTVTAIKALLDNPQFRQNLINLNSIEGNLTALPYPTDLLGRIKTLSESINDFESTVSKIEDGIRGSVLYPVS